MEKEIKNLVALANEYRDYGQRAFLDGGNINDLGNDVQVYFGNNYKTCSVSFNKYEKKEMQVRLFSSSIELDFGITLKDLQDTFIKYTEYLQTLEANLKANELTREQLVQQRVEELEKQIRDLKGETV